MTEQVKLSTYQRLLASVFSSVETYIQYVAQYPDGTSIRTLKTKTQFLRRPFQLSVNKVFRMNADISALR